MMKEIFYKYKMCILIMGILAAGIVYGVCPGNFSFFMRQAAVMIFLTVGVSLECISGDFDLAFTAQISAASLIGVFMISKGIPVVVSCGMIFVFNGLVGCLKGFLLVKMRMPSIIFSLALQMILANFCAGITDNSSIVIVQLKELYRNAPMNLVCTILVILGASAAFFFLEQTYYGKYCRMLGENLELAKMSGLKCTEISMLIHAAVSVYFSVPTILLMLYTGSGSSSLGGDYLYKVLAAVCLGQNMVRREKESVAGMALGAVTVVLFTCILTARGYLNRWENILAGITILACLSISSRIRPLKEIRKV